MIRLKKVAIIATSVAAAVLILCVGAVYAYEGLTNRLGAGWMLMVAHPRDAYTIRRGPRDMDWQGLHIHVDSAFVLTRNGESVMAHHINRPLWLLGPSVIFIDAERTNGLHFASEEEWCATASDRCTVNRPGAANGNAVCLQYRGARQGVTRGDVETWRCRLPSGIEARFSGRRREIPGFQRVVDDAFATAPPAFSAMSSDAGRSTSR